MCESFLTYSAIVREAKEIAKIPTLVSAHRSKYMGRIDKWKYFADAVKSKRWKEYLRFPLIPNEKKFLSMQMGSQDKYYDNDDFPYHPKPSLSTSTLNITSKEQLR